MVVAALAGTLASATPDISSQPPSFAVESGGLALTVQLGSRPMPAAIGELRARARVCPVALHVEEGIVSARPDDDCHPLARLPVAKAVSAWHVDVRGTPGRDRQVAELMYVFGPDETATDPSHTRLYAVPSAGVRFVVTDPRVRQYPIRADAIAFPTYPDDAPADTRRTTCSARLEVDSYGTPVDVDVTRCDALFVAPTVAALRKWHFTPHPGDDLPFRLVSFRARYARAPESLDVSEVTLFEPSGIRVDVLATVQPPAAPEPETALTRATPVKRVVPRLGRRDAAALTERTVCRFSVEVDERGRPGTITVENCPEGLVPAVRKSLRRWRWKPAERDGRPVPSVTQVRVRLDPVPSR